MNSFEFSVEFKKRTQVFALSVIKLNKALSDSTEYHVIVKQLEPLLSEANEILSIVSTARKTAKSRK